jgi:hypothetical protein
MKFVGNTWKLSPSDLTFLYDECPRCFWLKVAGNLPRPRTPFPKVFTLLDIQTKRFFEGKRTEKIASGLRPGRVAFGDRWVRSGPIHVPSHPKPVFIAGRFDSAFRFDDGTYGVVDFKTTNPKDGHIPLYGRQLHAYAHALEHAASGNLVLAPVSQLGLLCAEPVSMIPVKAGVAYKAALHWIEVERDDESFLKFLSQVLDILERPAPPEAAVGCPFCAYVMDGVLSMLAQVRSEEAAAG